MNKRLWVPVPSPVLFSAFVLFLNLAGYHDRYNSFGQDVALRMNTSVIAYGAGLLQG